VRPIVDRFAGAWRFPLTSSMGNFAMYYRLSDGTIHAQRGSGQDWVPLSKTEANDLLRRLSDDDASPAANRSDSDQPQKPTRH
jgi:hypothetical protein